MSEGEKIDMILKMQESILKIISRIEDRLNGRFSDGDFVSKKRAMELIGCKETKLQKLVLDGKVQVNANPGRGKQIRYELKSIKAFIRDPDV